jgi:hypothetical protein
MRTIDPVDAGSSPGPRVAPSSAPNEPIAPLLLPPRPSGLEDEAQHAATSLEVSPDGRRWHEPIG